jgi:hypothetical protein
MTLDITDTDMRSDATAAGAEFRPHAAADGSGAWVVSWLPERLLTRNEAITAMTLAERVTAGQVDGQVDSWAAELGLPVSEVLRRLP